MKIADTSFNKDLKLFLSRGYEHLSSLARWSRLYIDTKIYCSACCASALIGIFFSAQSPSQKVIRHHKNFLCASCIFSVLLESFEIYLFLGESFNQKWNKCTLTTRQLPRDSVLEVAQQGLLILVTILPCESEGKIFLICHVITQLKFHVAIWGDFSHVKSPPC